MNQEQRKYLIAQVDSTCRNQIEALEKQKPIQPSLNNYLIASFLDGSIKFKDLTKLKEKIREKVLKLGQNDALIEEDDDDRYYSSRKRRSNEKQHFVKLIAEDLFVIPEGYLTAQAEYQEKFDEIEEKIKNLEATRKTIEMKIQIGSSSTMDKLVMQVDNMGDLNLMNTQLMLGNGE